jgi:hypothetical protein
VLKHRKHLTTMTALTTRMTLTCRLKLRHQQRGATSLPLRALALLLQLPSMAAARLHLSSA